MSKHTNGRWVKGWGNGLTGPTTISAGFVCAGGKDWKWEPISNGQETIGIAVMQENKSIEELEANANLITAAPTLLNTLIKLKAEIDAAAFHNAVHAITTDEAFMIDAAISQAVKP